MERMGWKVYRFTPESFNPLIIASMNGTGGIMRRSLQTRGGFNPLIIASMNGTRKQPL